MIFGYKCDCFDKFIGENCENLKDFCLFVFCWNGGRCKIESVGEYFFCMCLVGFIGKICEVNIDDCVLSFCMLNFYC